MLQTDNASSALLMLSQRNVDVLVTDIGLPDVSGELFAAEARALRPALRIVFATGGNVIRDMAHDDASPVLLRKPYSVAGLAAALAKAK